MVDEASVVFTVDLRRFSRSIRKLVGSGPIIDLIKSALDAATIVSDIKMARESIAAARAIHEEAMGTSVSSRDDIRPLALAALLDTAIIRYARGVFTGGTRHKIKIENELPTDLKQIHRKVVQLRDKYIAHSITSENIDSIISNNTIAQYIQTNMEMNSRFPEFYERGLDFDDFERLFDAALVLVRKERNLRVDKIQEALAKIRTADNPILQKFHSTPFDPYDFYPNRKQADSYLARKFEEDDNVYIDINE